MSTAGTSLSRRVESKVQRLLGDHPLQVGEPVRVRAKASPLSGESGMVVEVNPLDAYGPYLVRFDSGLQFRYRRSELALTCSSDSARENR